MINLQHITLRRATKELLEDVNLTLYAGQKIGLIGDNGCGKSSFFAMLRGTLEPHHGELSLPTNLEIAEVKQDIPTTTDTAIDYVIDGDRRYRALEKRLNNAIDSGDAHLLSACHDQFAQIDGYAITGKAEKILRGLGFSSDALSNPTNSFSGGWRMRLNLAQALMSRSDLLLLDEPTNHLDLDAIIWLEKWLQDYSGTLLVISHDREFLDNTITFILHFHEKNLQFYKGNYSAFEKQRAERLAIQQATYEKQQAQRAHMQSFIDRFGAKASKARQAQSRYKALQKMELISAVQTRSSFQFSFKAAKACPNPLLQIEHATVGYASDKPVLIDINLQLAPSDRIGLLGVNGAGKSTLIKVLSGKLQPMSGSVHSYKGLTIGYFAQHQVEHLDLQLSPLELLRETAPTANEQTYRSFLGSFNFSGEMAAQKIVNFSGGEKARLALALIVWQAPNLLLLDEPTNHLDMSMREALILALQTYEGALIVVSHDRHLIRTTTDELMVVANKTVERFRGDLEDYKQNLLQKTAEKPVKLTSPKKNSGKEKPKLETQLASIEKTLSSLQTKKLALDNLLANPALYKGQQQESIQEYTRQLKELNAKIKVIENDWFTIISKLSES